MALHRKIAPALTPVTLAEAKLHCTANDFTDDDAMLGIYISAATARLDGLGILGRCLISQTWELYYDTFPCGNLQIPLGKLISVASVEYIDPTTLSYVAWDPANYDVDLFSDDGWIVPVDTWPTIADSINAVRVTFTAGYGDAPSDVPDSIRVAILMMVANWYANRETVVVGSTVSTLPLGAEDLLAPYRRVGF
ncbi:MAG: head-tail connector protein [Aestuariivirga sp.]